MNISFIDKETDWQDDPHEFLQSWQYGEFLSSLGRKVIRIRVGDTCVQYIEYALPFGKKYAYLPRVRLCQDAQNATILFLKGMGYIFARVESIDALEYQNINTRTVPNRQPQHTWLLNITPSEEILFANMHQKTRYNIRLGQRNGVVVDDTKDIDIFWPLYQETVKRNAYEAHPKTYIQAFLSLPHVYQMNAHREERVIASAICFLYNTTWYYVFGASANNDRHTMAAYALHWRAIEKAKMLGCDIYNFWGIAAPAKQGSAGVDCFHNYCWSMDDPLAGVARFKAGFGGYIFSYPQAVDLIFHPMMYMLLRLKNALLKRNIPGYSA